MKKSVIFVIGVVFAAAILVIGFFGMKTVVYSEIVYVTKITITNEEMETGVDGNNYIMLEYSDTEPTGVQLSYMITPTTATTKDVKFTYDTSVDFASVTNLGLVIFTGVGAIKVTIKATDGSAVSTSVIVWAY